MTHNLFCVLLVPAFFAGAHPCFSSPYSDSDTTSSDRDSDGQGFDHVAAPQQVRAKAFDDGTVQLRYLGEEERRTIDALCLEMPDSADSSAYLPPSVLREEIEGLQEELYKSERAKYILGQRYPHYIMQIELAQGRLEYAQQDLEEARGIIAAQVEEIARLQAHVAELAAKLTTQSATEDEKLAGAPSER